MVSNSNQFIVAHHVRCFGWGGVGIKPSDYRVVPLTHEEHADLHNYGEQEFWNDHDIDPRAHIAAQMMVYLKEEMLSPISMSDQEFLTNKDWEDILVNLEDRIIATRYPQ